MHLHPESRKKKRLTYGTGAFHGWWHHRDMAIADDMGCILRVDETWVPDKFTTMFQSDRWQELRIELRSLGRLGKMADNAIWGLMTFDGTNQRRVAWPERSGEKPPVTIANLNGIREIDSIGVALAATSRVREKLWHAIKATNAIQASTDGIIAKQQIRSPLPPEWVVKQQLTSLDIKDFNCYAYTASGAVITQYLRGGKAAFEAHSGKKNYQIGDLETCTLPSMSVCEAHKKGHLHE